ncbi:glycosyltransferase family 4 protein [Desulfofundulus sp. TPOSR]|uniref:glycosyltransferase family 4 protein n=1 Tax=Desulfofundulus sp. TPOSR TaxID=2714340 RepID=UPI0014099037|nr:glycosyltransferase family 4 protein [Desulfofundulus sp. TPOSR]NHM28244.1 glycosyltransferase family 4 protein [Desulfofundulus sp. TPOSR]
MSWEVVVTRSNPVLPDPRVSRLVRCLKGAGYHCSVLAWARERLDKTGLTPGYPCCRMYFPGRFGGGFLNLFGLLVFNLWLLWNHLKTRPPVIHAYDLDTVLPALLARCLVKSRVVYDIADWYADSRKVGCLKPLANWLERLACRAADLVVLAHESRIEQTGFSPRRWVVFYNTPEEIDCLANHGEHTEPGDYFVYVGVLQPDRGIEQIIRAALAVGARLTIAGFGPLSKMCASESGKEDLVTFRGRVSYEEALALQRGAIAILALYDPAVPNNRFAAPNKLYEAMMLGRPIITSGGTLVGEIVEREGIGLVVPYDDVQRLGDAMRFLASHPEECERMGRKGRQLYEQRYSFARQCQAIQEAYRSLVESAVSR